MFASKNTYSIVYSPLVQLIFVRIKLVVALFLGTTLDELELHNSGWGLLLGLVLWICLLIIALETLTALGTDLTNKSKSILSFRILIGHYFD